MQDRESAEYESLARHYDLMIGDRVPFIGFYSGLLRQGQLSLIDFGCGTGTITAAMAKVMRHLNPHSNSRVAGLDGSPAMLAVAAQHDPGIEWILGDLRQPPVEGPFELAISCYNTLQHLDGGGLLKSFRAIRSILAAGGRFAFDIYRPNLPYIRMPQSNRLARSLRDSAGRDLEIREDTDFDEASRVLTITWRLQETDWQDRSPLAQTRYRMWQHEPEAVETALAQSGFSIAERFGGLDGSPFTATSKKQVVVCRAI